MPYSPTLKAPGDRRRFVAYAQARNLPFELARFEERYDIVILSEVADLSIWPNYRQGKVVYDLINSYLSIPRTNWRQLLRGPAWYALGRHKRLQDYLSSLRAMCRRADAVVCTTDEQKEAISQFCSNTHVILDIHSTVATKIKTQYTASRPFRLVWEGLASNLSATADIGANSARACYTTGISNCTLSPILSNPDFRADCFDWTVDGFWRGILIRSVSMIGRKKRARKSYRHAILRSFRLISMIPSP